MRPLPARRCAPLLAALAAGPAAAAPAPDPVPWLEVQLTTVVPAAVADPPEGAGAQRIRTQPAMGMRFSATPLPHTTAQLTLLAYPLPSEQQGWAPDFTYLLGWGDWRPGSWFVEHANYTATRYPWRDGPTALPLQGMTTGGRRYQWPEAWRAAMGPRWWAGGALMAGYAIAYGRPDGSTGWNLAVLSHTTQLSWREHLFGEVRVFLYPIPNQQQTWDPDFTWSLGWMDWRPWRLSARWANYAGNRWPGRELEGNGGLGRGALFVDFELGWP